ncbi:hypothetical protein [Blastococcus sp. CT_GayMR16]|uniref:hypothetical protein n=1 Tax=Blastococcus sp. CT_GayMR16 TaxID=2559607 RepID=UPI0014322951|nr:hypothetical protein [Blastococcus sp. CT_GayMR16]
MTAVEPPPGASTIEELLAQVRSRDGDVPGAVLVDRNVLSAHRPARGGSPR